MVNQMVIHTSMHQSLTCSLVFHANQYSTKNCYDDEEKYCGTSHQHPNDDRSLEPGREGEEIGSLQDEGLYI